MSSNNEKPVDGYNPLLWDCVKQGCFNKKKRPKIEMFKDAFPGKISFGDVDGIVEINGHALMLEWKPPGTRQLKTGQQIMYERLTKTAPLTVVCVAGNPETMEIEGFWSYQEGKNTRFEPADFDTTKARIKRWAGNALRNGKK